VTVDSKRYSELHVDGGTTRELFIGPITLPLSEYDRVYDRKPLRRIFIVKNGKVSPEQDAVQPQTISLAARAISTLIKNQSLGDTYRLYRMTKDDGGEFHFAAVPAAFEVKADEFFDPDYQRALYDEGYRLGRAGGQWLNRPPDAPGD